MSDLKSEAAYDVLRQVRPLYLASMRAVEGALAGTSMTVAMRAILELLIDDGPQPVPQLARSLGITRQGVQRVVDAALEEGYVERRQNPGHQRSKLIGPTPSGRSAFERLHAAELATLGQALTDLDTSELTACADVLGRFVRGIRVAE